MSLYVYEVLVCMRLKLLEYKAVGRSIQVLSAVDEVALQMTRLCIQKETQNHCAMPKSWHS